MENCLILGKSHLTIKFITPSANAYLAGVVKEVVYYRTLPTYPPCDCVSHRGHGLVKEFGPYLIG